MPHSPSTHTASLLYFLPINGETVRSQTTLKPSTDTQGLVEEMDKMANESPPPKGGERVVVLTALKLLMGLVFTGWLVLWIARPTNAYRNSWSPNLLEKTNSTYFGGQGTNILVFTFPILFISVLACVYLHLSKKDTHRDLLSGHLESWKRPVLVKSPPGIVSGTEFAFSLMFIALLIWCFSTWLSTGFARIDPKSVEENGEKMWQAKLETASIRLGLVGNVALAFLFFPVTRGSSLLPLVGLTSEASIKYHIWIGHIVMVLLTAHGLGFIIYWAATNQISAMLHWAKADVSIVAGEISLLGGLVMWVTTFPRLRRNKFELFFYTHQLYLVFLLFFLLHLGIAFFCYILPGVYLFMLDRYLRFLQSRRRVRLLSARLLPSETIELNFSKIPGLSFTPMSSVFINVPSISSLQWHPFTVSSSCNLEPERLTVIIKKEGKWTQKLYEILSSPSLVDRLDISVEGPYSPASVNFLRYDSLVMVSGGSGLTPFISVIRELIYLSTRGVPTPSVLLICAFKTSADLTMLDLLLPISGNMSDLSRLQLRIEAFVTRDDSQGTDVQKLIRNLWFKPSSTDLPLAPVLGPNGWLWLAAIISTSFISYLVLIGLLNRYYIYPIDHNTDAIYSYTAKALLNVLFICVCIASAASAVVLWNKRRSTMEAKQVQIVDAATPTTSPSSWFYNAERELESVPHESIVQATKVHHGKRPDLKTLLLGCEASNTGVMVSGPRRLRHDVAKVCASGLAQNLHFESISFSW